MSNVTRLPPSGNKVHVEADIPASQLDEFDRAITAIAAGERPRMDILADLHRWMARYGLLPRES